MIKRPTRTETSWVRAVILGFLIVVGLITFLAWIPSYFTYWWSAHDLSAQKTIQSIVHKIPGFTHHTDQPYTSTRVRDAISMGFQTTVLAVVLAWAYISGEKKRRRLGQRGSDDVKGYLPGK